MHCIRGLSSVEICYIVAVITFIHKWHTHTHTHLYIYIYFEFPESTIAAKQTIRYNHHRNSDSIIIVTYSSHRQQHNVVCECENDYKSRSENTDSEAIKEISKTSIDVCK